MIPLILLHIPALMAYLSMHGSHDTYAVRRNARDVVEAYKQQDRDAILKAVEKCKGTLTARNVTEKSLVSMHEALCKKYTSLPRPVDDQDSCDQQAWGHEASFIRDLFGFQVSHPTQGTTHPLCLDIGSHLPMQQGIEKALVNMQIHRLPLLLVLTAKGHQNYMYTVTIQKTVYSLVALANEEEVYYRTQDGIWYRSDKQCTRLDTVLHVKHPSVFVYARS